jgi:hypothetical protein
MKPDVNSGSLITEQKAKDLIDAFQINFPNEIISSFIGKNNVENLLQQEDCVGIRIYNGYDEVERKISLVLVGVDSNDDELLNDGLIYDELIPCPSYCPSGITIK